MTDEMKLCREAFEKWHLYTYGEAYDAYITPHVSRKHGWEAGAAWQAAHQHRLAADRERAIEVMAKAILERDIEYAGDMHITEDDSKILAIAAYDALLAMEG